MKYAYSFLLALFLSSAPLLLCGQTTVAIMNFDGSTPEMPVSSDVAFFDNNSLGFFGIHDGNGNPNDGTPTDTGDGNASDIAAITLSTILRDFLFVNDLQNSGGNGTAGDATVTFGPVSVSGQSNLLFSFDYDVVGFDGGDDVDYRLILDGVPQGIISLVDGTNGGGTSAQGTENIIIPDGTASVSLELIIDQNGPDDQAAFDNFIVSADNPGQPCGITSFGPASEACLATTAADNTDGYEVTVPYDGVDTDVIISVTVGGSPVTFTNTGDNPASTPNGTLIINSASFIEGTSYEITLRGGECLLPASGSVAPDFCTPACDLDIDPADIRLFCDGLSSGTDNLTGELRFSGTAQGASVSISPSGSIGGSDPAVDDGGTITFAGLQEGITYTLTIDLGNCGAPISERIVIASDFCQQSSLIINEVLADDGNIDANNDGSTSGVDDEFVELYNISGSSLDVSGWTVEENAGIFYRFAAGTTIPSQAAFVIFDGGSPNLDCQADIANVNPFIGLNNSGDIVVVRDAAGKVRSQMSYGSNGNNDQSLALNPDGNLSGGYVLHTTIPTNPVVQSACLPNGEPAGTLPVEMMSFTGRAQEKSVLLEWSTLNEENNDKFIVERSPDGQVFRQISSVPAQEGNQDAYREYQFVDPAPLAGQNYYRLRQVDLDGSYAIYGPVSVSFATYRRFLYPNPAREVLQLTGTFSGEERLTLLAADGRRLRELPLRADIDVRDLKPGIYLLRLEDRREVSLLRFVKQ
jgi:hypothetical protein